MPKRFWIAAAIIVVLFSIPCITGKDGVANGLYQAACILVAFPLLVLLGAGSRTTDSFSTKFCKFLGDISYPLYVTHYSLIYVHMSFAQKYADAPAWMHVAQSVAIFFLAIGIAWASFKLYDLPVRKWLTENWLKGGKSLPKAGKAIAAILASVALATGLYYQNCLKFIGLEAPQTEQKADTPQFDPQSVPQEVLDTVAGDSVEE